MLTIHVPEKELWDAKAREFVRVKAFTLQLEHSLLALSKWESKWCKPFLTDQEKTKEETLDYIRCMTVNQNVDPKSYEYLRNDDIEKINEYIRAPMTATWFNEKKNNQRRSSEQVTSELIYYWMVAMQIPWEAQKWHLNRLLTLIRICSIKNEPPKKMSKRDVMSRNAQLNAMRRAKSGSLG